MNGRVALATLLPAVPFAAALAGLVLPLRGRRAAAVLGVGSTAVALLAAVLLVAFDEIVYGSATVVEFGDIAVTAGVDVDMTAALVAVAVGVVACAVQVYSVAYLREDSRYVPYAAQVSLFTAAMLLVVVASDLIQLLVGWEVMGICSYLLIGHDRRLPEAPGAAVKAFLVTRVGDVGFLLGIVILGIDAGSFQLGAVFSAAVEGQMSTGALTAACLLLLAGAAGKSAQFPLHTWLPDAMAGPTPISALIHAATMVAAGAYVVARLLPLYAVTPAALATLGVMASVTMLLAACAALAQDDLKRVLAWSTVSQVGYMMGGLAVAAADAAMFHLLTHAAFKALLFLAAGAVIHAVGSNLMRSMGGLRAGMPVTFWTMTLGFLALAGVPVLAGFWSKESVLAAALETSRGHGLVAAWVGRLVFAAGMVTVLLTAAYVARAWLRTFFGAPRTSGVHAHDPEPLMRWPLIVLAIPTVVLGVVGLYDLEPGGALLPHVEMPVTVAAVALVLAGFLVTWAVWRFDTADDPAWALGPLRPVFDRAFYLDEVQDALVVRPVVALARAVRRADEQLVDGAVEGTGTGTLGLGRLVARAHAGLPRYAAAALAGVTVIGVVVVVVEGLR